MTPRRPEGRSGITLTEILISIFIMGVGILSLATLFPLGLIRLRDAQRMSRSAFLAESAVSDLGTRNLLSVGSFAPAVTGTWYVTASGWFNPWLQDTPSTGTDWHGTAPVGTGGGVYRGFGGDGTGSSSYNFLPGPGLPVAYDPLWRSFSGGNTAAGTPAGVFPGSALGEGRFGWGMNVLPSGAGGNGLQRITNLNTVPSAVVNMVNPGVVADIFVSPEDLVLQDESGGGSPIMPDLSLSPGSATVRAQTVQDWRYSWMFTGQLTDARDATIFDGDVVIYENRPLGYDPVASGMQATGETVVQAVFGFSGNVSATGFGVGADKTILIRWAAGTPDPDVRVGSWIADVTYQRDLTTANTLYAGNPFPAQRCYWYQIVKRTDPADESTNVGLNNAGGTFRAMTVWVSSNLRAKTPLSAGTPPSPLAVEAALVNPSVVNVVPRTVQTR